MSPTATKQTAPTPTRHGHAFQHVAIIGPGAMGLVIAMRLARTGGTTQVTLIDHRPDRAARLSDRPLVLVAPEGRMEARLPVRTAPDPSAPAPDLVVLATKAHAAATAAEAASTWIGRAAVLVLQNGLGAPDEVARQLPGTTVMTAVSYQAAHVIAEGQVRHVANLTTHIGYEGRSADDLARDVVNLFCAAGLPASAEPDMRPVVWAKLVINAAINPVAALAGVANGEVAARPTLRSLAEAAAEEGEAVARAHGLTLPYSGAAEVVLETAQKTAENRCSMLQDLQQRRRTEIEYLNGAIVRVARRHGLKAPTNHALASLVRQVSATGPEA